MKQLYFCKEFNEAFAYDMDTLKDMAKHEALNQITVTKAIPDPCKDHFYCKEFGFVALKSQGECGKICEGYTPKNGKSGMCKFQGKCYEPIGESITVKIQYK